MTELTTVCLLLSNGSNNRHRGRQVLFAFEYKNYWNNILNDVQRKIKSYSDKKNDKNCVCFHTVSYNEQYLSIEIQSAST